MAATTLPHGVIKPNRSERPLPTAIKVSIQAERVRSAPFTRADVPCAIRTIPTAALSSSSPSPGGPLGKVENSLCSVDSFATSSVTLEGNFP